MFHTLVAVKKKTNSEKEVRFVVVTHKEWKEGELEEGGPKNKLPVVIKY